MEADRIKDIISKLDDLTYRCILFDGEWGIGKTYAIEDVLSNNEGFCKISMFGLQNSHQIYHEIVCQLANFDGMTEILEKIDKFTDKISLISDKAKKIKGIINSFIDEKELFKALSKGFSSWHYIVIDDLERLSKNVSLEEVMGIIEEIKGCNYVKVILVANQEKMEIVAKQVLKEYEEKVIDRVYYITERPKNINWGKMKIDATFMQDFLKKHNVKNLRTLQKAQNFYDDVKIYTKFINNDYFQEDVRIICFAIVIESIENLYYKKVDDNEAAKENNIIQHIHNELEYRIMYYLSGIKSSKSLVLMLIKYFNNEISIDENKINIEYQNFLKSGNKPNYYKTESEIRQILLTWKEQIDVTKNLAELNNIVSEYVFYNDILEENSDALLKRYEEKLYDIINKMVSEGNENVLVYSFDIFGISSDRVKQIYQNICAKKREELIDTFIDHLNNSTSDRKAFEYSYNLRKYYDNVFYKNIIEEKSDKLYSLKSLPIDDMNEDKYYTCYNIMSILYQIDNEQFLKYCDGISCDKMANYRIKQLVEKIVRG